VEVAGRNTRGMGDALYGQSRIAQTVDDVDAGAREMTDQSAAIAPDRIVVEPCPHGQAEVIDRPLCSRWQQNWADRVGQPFQHEQIGPRDSGQGIAAGKGKPGNIAAQRNYVLKEPRGHLEDGLPECF
jgi:hypothetical protein